MADINEIARPYAQAAFDFALEYKQLDAWFDFLQTSAAVVDNEQVAILLHNPNITDEQWIEFFVSFFNERLNDAMQNFLRLLINYNRLIALPKIVDLFRALMADYEKIANVRVISAYPLTDKQEAMLKTPLEKRLNRTVNIESEVDASILGGAIIRVGNFVIDGSALSRLNQLKESL